MEDIQVGEFCRCGAAGIREVKEVIKSPVDFSIKQIKDHKDLLIKYDYIQKHNKSIMQLLEKGDYINGFPITNFYLDVATRERILANTIVGDFKEEDIETIVTKEEFKNREFKIKRD